MYKLIFLIFFLINTSFLCFSQNAFSEGKELFENNSVEDALEYLEEALVTNPNNDVYKYLGESYYILEMYEDSVLVLEEAVANVDTERDYFFFKLGNAYFSSGNYKDALNSYLQVITMKEGYLSDAFLNIAQVSLELKLYPSAIDNYKKYLELEPKSPQKRKIIKLILKLQNAFREEEAIKAEELRKKEEEARLREEERLAKEAEERALEEERARQIAENQRLEHEKELRARELEEERLLYDQEQKALAADKTQLAEDEAKVLNPPDPVIEERKVEIKNREEELLEREIKVLEGLKALQEAEKELELNKEALDNIPQKTEEELRLEEEARIEREREEKLRLEEEERQEALMNDILQSLDKIGENAKGINAASEGAIGELEGSDIDE